MEQRWGIEDPLLFSGFLPEPSTRRIDGVTATRGRSQSQIRGVQGDRDRLRT
ncbi:hypothetical protein [Oscillatoria sp. HE19RPO]|uniref:hypothetical protein n=1 Tax=Oscillatoria sp. HE19RPO TaxID=2954806 RepID=UPI0020C230BD|nr:hypothetical protein [Oscillatoria sp. HE19RPO]